MRIDESDTLREVAGVLRGLADRIAALPAGTQVDYEWSRDPEEVVQPTIGVRSFRPGKVETVVIKIRHPEED